MTLIVDASFVVAALTYEGIEGAWAGRLLNSDDLAAPYLMPVEAANTLRLAVLRGDLSDFAASVAHAGLRALGIQFHAYEPFAERVWQLRENVIPYDAWYVALAEALDAPLATLDRRLSRAPGPRCEFLVPPVA